MTKITETYHLTEKNLILRFQVSVFEHDFQGDISQIFSACYRRFNQPIIMWLQLYVDTVVWLLLSMLLSLLLMVK